MKKRDKIIYWIATCWLALGMVSTGLVQLLKVEEEVQNMTVHLGYPMYFMTILGTWKLLGSIAVLIPRFPQLKEWAYAGFFFAMTGAIISRIAVGDAFTAMLPALFLLTLTVVSWYMRPESRRLIRSNN
ncbi:MAG: DoxX family protein [Bacteroidetes bacterium]|nr:DoxX family protein [Bacteroidota bacterium]